MAIGEIRKEIIVGVASSILTGAIIWALAQGGTFVRRTFLPELPGDAVVMFDGKCPEGWRLYNEVGGRFVVGAGPHSNKDENGEKLRDYNPWTNGGEERVALSPDQLPSHNHSIRFAGPDIGITGPERGGTYGVRGLIDSTKTGDTGENLPHNNMPPFIALSFCKKD